MFLDSQIWMNGLMDDRHFKTGPESQVPTGVLFSSNFFSSQISFCFIFLQFIFMNPNYFFHFKKLQLHKEIGRKNRHWSRLRTWGQCVFFSNLWHCN
jgi:hypothetical protein